MTPTPIKPALTAALYVRVSTSEQHTELQTTDLQDFISRMGWNSIEYTEKASAVKKRPELARLMADAKQRKFDVVIVWKLDRFARSLPDLLNNVRGAGRRRDPLHLPDPRYRHRPEESSFPTYSLNPGRRS